MDEQTIISRKWWGYVVLGVPAGIGTLGFMFSRVVPSDMGIHLGVGFGAISAAAWLYLSYAMRARFGNTAARGLRGVMIRNPMVRGLVSAGIGFMFGYSSLTWGFTWLFNLADGLPTTKSVVVVGWFERSSKNCAHPTVAGDIYNSPNALCAAGGAHAQIPVGTRLRLQGPASVLGLNVRTITVPVEQR